MLQAQKLIEYKALQEEMLDTFKKKNHDYGSAFDETMDMFGPQSALVRIFDKFNRLRTLVGGVHSEVTDESMRDTLLDMANYAMLATMWLDSQTCIEEGTEPEGIVTSSGHAWDYRQIRDLVFDRASRFEQDGRYVTLKETEEYQKLIKDGISAEDTKDIILGLFFTKLVRHRSDDGSIQMSLF